MKRPLAIGFVLAFAQLAGSAGASDLEIHCLDVGQGEATLIIAPSGQTFLFDGGWNGQGNGTIIPHLNSLGIGPLLATILKKSP